ncbi:MAG: PIG-L deacetylase family protein [Mycetocola sp.]
MSELAQWLDTADGSRSDGVLVFHAHPDDETLVSGPVIAALREEGVPVTLVTATRGERGDIVAEARASVQTSGNLTTHRQRELDAACTALGIREHVTLGSAPARALGLPDTRYTDSGMRWIREGLAGPATDVTPDTFTSQSHNTELADLLATIAAIRPAALVGDDEDGGYGHPDHRRCHALLRDASRLTGIPAFVVGEETSAGWRIQPQNSEPIREALRAHASQLTLDADTVTHSGGQSEPIRTVARVRPLQF